MSDRYVYRFDWYDLFLPTKMVGMLKKISASLDSITLFRQVGVKLHKWHSNETILETTDPYNAIEVNLRSNN